MFARRSVAVRAALRSLTGAALTFAIMSPAVAQVAETAAADDCWASDEIAAARVGDLQSALMVLALKCQDTIPATLAAYNKFMADKRDVVVKDKHLIQAHFVRRMGSDEGLKAATDYDTRLGNRSSSPVVNVAQCQKAGAYARIAASAAEDDLPVLAGMVGTTPSLAECPVPVVVAAPAAMVIPVWAKPAPAVGPTGTTPVVATVASVGPAGPASNADAVKALQAAVAALSQVAASLQSAAVPVAAPAAPAPIATDGSDD